MLLMCVFSVSDVVVVCDLNVCSNIYVRVVQHIMVWLTCEGPLDRRGGSFKYRSLDRSQKVATWLIDSQGAQAWNKGRPTGLFSHHCPSLISL